MPKQPRGRPEGSIYPHVRSLRFSDRDLERLRRLAEKLELPEVVIIRQALKEKAEREGAE
jgi:predicted transcriptional regulator